MKALFKLFVPMVLGVLMASACGGDSKSPATGAAAGSSAGGASDVLGGAAGIGDVSAGASNAGAAPTTAGAAGAGGADPACPGAAPTAGDMCTLPGGTACPYPTSNTRCTCGMRGGNANAARTWACAPTLMCPAAAPATGAMCTAVTGGNGANRCMFGTTQCTCQNAPNGAAGQVWSCLAPGPIMCPAAAPKSGDACTQVLPGQNGMNTNQCVFPTAQCDCQNDVWNCRQTGPLVCPAAAPTTGAACIAVVGNNQANTCAFGTTQCTCQNAANGAVGQAWSCLTPITCPATAPAAAAMCTAVPGGNNFNQCTFPGDRCTCQNAPNAAAGQAWNCVPTLACPATEPTTGAVCTAVAGGNQNNACTFGTDRCTCQNAPNGGAGQVWSCLGTGPIMCPAAAPKNGDVCAGVVGGGNANQCMFTGLQCTCDNAPTGAGRVWACLATGPLVCPATPPANDAACTAVVGNNAANQCTFPTAICNCQNAASGIGQVWSCLPPGPIMCPAAAPATGAACTLVAGGNNANRCTIGTSQCTCRAGAAGAAAWSCLGAAPLVCPATLPTNGAMCSAVVGGNQANRCTFGPAECTCQNAATGVAQVWSCVTPIACPTATPTANSACTPASGGAANNTCTFGNVDCVCTANAAGTAGTWTCM
jgi:hypothetical protein